MSAAKRKALALEGTYRKSDGHWHLEIPDVGCRSENTSVLVCIKEIEEFFKELFDDEDLNINLKLNDGGNVKVTAIPNK